MNKPETKKIVYLRLTNIEKDNKNKEEEKLF